MKGTKIHTNKLTHYLKAPIRVLYRARDMYVKSLSGCAGRVHYGGTPLPKSFSVNSSRVSEDEDIKALMRAMSQRSMREAESMRSNGLPKSFSVGIGRIDEEKPSDFQDDLKINSDLLMYPRSKSYAVTKRTGMLA